MKIFSRPKIRLVSASCYVVAILLANCGGSTESEPSATGDEKADAIGDGERSDGESDSDQLPQSFCQSDGDCEKTDQVCDSTRSVCVECTESADCDADAICRNSTCTEVTSCDSSKDCDTDQVCSDELNHCVECVREADCSDGEICHETKCEPTCSSDKDCRSLDQICNTALGICSECANHTDCRDGQFCSSAGACLDDVCDQDEATCSENTLVTCRATGDGFDTMMCDHGCASDGMACATEGSCVTGDEGCACYPNDTCNADLSCLSNFCVDVTSGTGGMSSGSGGSGTGGAGTGGSGTGGSGTGGSGTGGSGTGGSGTGGSGTGGAGTGGSGTGGGCASPDLDFYGNATACGETVVHNGSLYECITWFENPGDCNVTPGLWKCSDHAPDSVWQEHTWKLIMACP